MTLTSKRPTSPAARAIDLVKIYGTGEVAVRALDGVSLGIRTRPVHRGDGPVRLGQVDADALHGRARCADARVARSSARMRSDGLDDAALTQLRRDRVGFVFQSFNLVPTLTAAREHHAGRRPRPAPPVDRAWFDALVGQLGIADRLSHRPSELSGGQQQRVACARALIGRPELIFADEPTGNLDSNASAEVLEFLRRAVSEHGQSIVMVTHDPLAAAYADRVVFLADGKRGGRASLAVGRRRARADEEAGRLRCAGSRSAACWLASCAWR